MREAAVSGSRCARVHFAASAASELNHSVPIAPVAAASWFPSTETAPASASRATTPFGSDPYPTVSPRFQIVSTPRSSASASTASSATRFACTSEISATRTTSLPLAAWGAAAPLPILDQR